MFEQCEMLFAAEDVFCFRKGTLDVNENVIALITLSFVTTTHNTSDIQGCAFHWAHEYIHKDTAQVY